MIVFRRSIKFVFTAFILLLVFLPLTACAESGSFPTPSLPTAEPTYTPYPTPTVDPWFETFEEADRLWSEKKWDQSLAAYISVLNGTEDLELKNKTAKRLVFKTGEIESQAVDAFHTASNQAEIKAACEIRRRGLTAYDALISSNFWSDPKDSNYLDAYRATSDYLYCLGLGEDPPLPTSEKIRWLADKMALYPDDPTIKSYFTENISNLFSEQVKNESATNPEDIGASAKVIRETLGDINIGGMDLDRYVHTSALSGSLCSGRPSDLPLQTSAVKKFFSCDFNASGALWEAGLGSEDPAEIWYLVEYSRVDNPPVTCSAVHNNTGKAFTYTYPGQFQEIYTVKDAITGGMRDQKVFLSTAPRCVFINCQLNTLSNTAACDGGEPLSTFNPEALKNWLTGLVN